MIISKIAVFRVHGSQNDHGQLVCVTSGSQRLPQIAQTKALNSCCHAKIEFYNCFIMHTFELVSNDTDDIQESKHGASTCK